MNKTLYILIILILSIIINITYIEVTKYSLYERFTTVLVPLNPLQFILFVVLISNIICLMMKIKHANLPSIELYIIIMISSYYRNMIAILMNSNLRVAHMLDLYYCSYISLIITCYVIILYLKRNLAQDIIIILYQLGITILNLVIEILYKTEYYTTPNFNEVVFIINAIQILILLTCTIYRIVHYVKINNNEYIIKILDTIFYITTLTATMVQTIRMNSNLYPF